jgi:hypothetical protein
MIFSFGGKKKVKVRVKVRAWARITVRINQS